MCLSNLVFLNSPLNFPSPIFTKICMIFVPPSFFQGRRLRPCFNGVDAPVAHDLRDDADISRQTRLLYARANMLLRCVSFLRPIKLRRLCCLMPSVAQFMDVSCGLTLSKSLFVTYMLPSIMPYGFY